MSAPISSPGSGQGCLARLLREAGHHAPREIHLGLERTRRILARLGHPERDLACVQVAGTNGKGSVIAFLTAMLEAATIQPGVYTSPHLERFNERIRLKGGPIDDTMLEGVLEETLKAVGEEEATFFEITTCAALLAFARARSPWVLLETGLGGRLDATSAVPVRLCVITAIGMDHMDYLGNTLTAIAREKGGILRQGIPLVCDPVAPEAVEVIEAMARARGAPCLRRGDGFEFTIHADGAWRFVDGAGELFLPPPALPGRHQYANAALAVAAARQLTAMGAPLTPATMMAGLQQAHWPGRLERFGHHPTVWLDGAHNPAAVEVLAQALKELQLAPVHLLFSALSDKDLPAMVAGLAPLVATVRVISVGGSRARPLEDLVHAWRCQGVEAIPCADLSTALASARVDAGEGGDVLVAGSLYLVGAVRSLLS